MVTTQIRHEENRKEGLKPAGHLDATNSAGLIKLFDSPRTIVFVCSFLMMVLLGWMCLDHRVPHHDSAWHSLYSTDVRRFLIHPRDWTMDNLLALGKQHFAYPPGAWAINGSLKIIFGNGSWGDKLCLAAQTLFLAVSMYKLSMTQFSDRIKSNLSVIFLLSFPLLCSLQRMLCIDLLQLSLFTGFLAALAAWNKKPSWKSALPAALLMGVQCLSKQTAVLYAGPLLALLFLIRFKDKEFKQATQLVFIGLSGVAFLVVFWVLPNYNEILAYIHWRSPESMSLARKVSLASANLLVSTGQICKGISPLLLILSSALILVVGWKKSLKGTGGPAIACVVGWFLIAVVAYYNTPESRYFGCVLVFPALAMASLCVDALRSERKLARALAYTLLIAAPLQMFVSCFIAAPVQKKTEAISPVLKLLGLDEFGLVLGYDRAGDPWKQRWIFQQIAAVEKHRWVWLNVLPSSKEFDQGSMVYVGQEEKSHAIPITWRTTMPDMSDSFKYSEGAFNIIDWFLLKTGDQGSPIRDPESKLNYDKTIERIEKGGDYQLKAETQLPDGSFLRLYRKDYAKIWNREAKLKAAALKAGVK